MVSISNQKPLVRLSEYIDTDPTKDLDIRELLDTQIIQQTMEPLNQNHPIGINPSIDEIQKQILNAMGDSIDPNAETIAMDFFKQTLTDIPNNTMLRTDDVYLAQRTKQLGLPEPNASVIYTTASDVQPAAKALLQNGSSQNIDTWFASIGHTYQLKTLAVSVQSDAEYKEFLSFLQQEIGQHSLDADCNRLMSEFAKTNLQQPVETYAIRNDDVDNNEPLSFARLLHSIVLKYAKTQTGDKFMVLPISLKQLLHPTTITFVNVEQHAKLNPKTLNNEWNQLKNLTNNKVVYSHKQINQLTKVARNVKKLKNQILNMRKHKTDVQKLQNRPFSKKTPTTVDIVKRLRFILKKIHDVNQSQNVYKITKTTFNKANRRDPDDYNKQGVITSTKYKPDIHIYTDTSGSISEENYQEIVKTLIQVAKKLDVNIYFNSFSHVISQESLIKTKGKSTKLIYKMIQKIPKVTGGTNYELVYNFIERNPRRQKELSILITDFEYNIPSDRRTHPSNLFYIPCSKMDYQNILHYAETFYKQLVFIDKKARQKILF